MTNLGQELGGRGGDGSVLASLLHVPLCFGAGVALAELASRRTATLVPTGTN